MVAAQEVRGARSLPLADESEGDHRDRDADDHSGHGPDCFHQCLGIVDFEAIERKNRKKPTARTTMNAPTQTTLMFLRRMKTTPPWWWTRPIS
jgi:hypothetical protein